jgi:isopentenyl-diphosphate Delta-isomerase
MIISNEHVVLVDEDNNILGTLPKSEIHQKETPLHRAFSIFIFNKKRDLLLQQRSSLKKTWPLTWSNSCCGHPQLNESNEDAARRRAKDELGLDLNLVREAAPYRYKFSKDGIMENEICPILVGHTEQEVRINPDEVEDVAWMSWADFLSDIEKNPGKYSPWCIEETEILDKSGKINE